MVELIKQNLSEIRKACEEHNVALLQLFGSAARVDDFTEKSDVVFLVKFHPQEEQIRSGFRRLEIRRLLKEKRQAIVNRKVDLVEEEAVHNKYLRYFINKDKVLLYGGS